MRECVDENEEVLQQRAQDAGKQAVKALKHESRKRTGKYAKGWKSTAQRGATGENAVRWAAQNADILIAPIALVLKDSMMGEITGNMAAAVGSSRATRILVPTERCGTHVAGAHGVSMQSLVEDAARQAAALAAQA